MATNISQSSGYADSGSPPSETPMLCAVPPTPLPALPAGLDADRAEALIVTARIWANGTRLHYYFFDRPTDGENVRFTDGSVRFVSWVGTEAARNLVRQAFAGWKALGIGLDFVEVTDRAEAEIRIGFMQGNGSWSYIGRDVLGQGPDMRTMNFGWNLAGDPNTALHEIGHTLGMPHEHQNPNAGIVWNEEAVYADLGGPPNNWDRQKTFNNIIRKLDPGEVQGSEWDPASVMHYPFKAGLILEPAQFRNGVPSPNGLSASDRLWVTRFYPPIAPSDVRTLAVGQSEPLALQSGEQANFLFVPPATRRYTIKTAGTCDTQISLFEEVDGAFRFVDADDDGGTDENARLRLRLRRERRYSVRVRMRFNNGLSSPVLIVT